MRRNGCMWAELQQLVQNCDDWRVIIGGLCPRWATGNDDVMVSFSFKPCMASLNSGVENLRANRTTNLSLSH